MSTRHVQLVSVCLRRRHSEAEACGGRREEGGRCAGGEVPRTSARTSGDPTPPPAAPQPTRASSRARTGSPAQPAPPPRREWLPLLAGRPTPAKCGSGPEAVPRPNAPSSPRQGCTAGRLKAGGETLQLCCSRGCRGTAVGSLPRWGRRWTPRPASRGARGLPRSPLCLYDFGPFVSKGSCIPPLPGVSEGPS